MLPRRGLDEMRAAKPPALCAAGLRGVSLPRRVSAARAGGLAWQEALPQPPGCAGSGWEGGDICLTLLSASVTWCVFSQELITLQHVLINIWSWSRVATEQNAKRVELWSGEAQKGLGVKNGRW